MNRRSDSFLYLRRRNKNTQIMHLRALILPHYPGAQERNDGGPPEKFFRFAKISASNGHLKPIFFFLQALSFAWLLSFAGEVRSNSAMAHSFHQLRMYLLCIILASIFMQIYYFGTTCQAMRLFCAIFLGDQLLNLPNGISCLSPP